MSISLSDLHLRYIVEYTIKTVRDNPDRYLPEIFGDAKLTPHDSLLGNRMITNVKNWLNTTKINVVHGFDLSQVELPCVTINMAQSSPSQPFLGDFSGINEEQINNYEREVIVPEFSPLNIEYSPDRSFVWLEVNEMMPKAEYVMAGMSVFDAKNQEYAIGYDEETLKLTISPVLVSIENLDASRLTVVSPLKTKRYEAGAMQYQDNIRITIHGHQNRNETIYLHSIILWGLLRFRPFMVELFNIDLGMPSSSDLEMQDRMVGQNQMALNVWIRDIFLNCKVIHSWSGAQMQDIIGLLLTINYGRN